MQELYRHYDDNGNLLYVGISLSTVRRLSQHKKSQHFGKISRVEVERYATKAEAMEAEKRAIISEKPKYNVCHNADKNVIEKEYYRTKTYETILKPCPFCGAMPELFMEMIHAVEDPINPVPLEDIMSGKDHGGAIDYMSLECVNPACRVRPRTAKYGGTGAFAANWFWNRKRFKLTT